MATLACPPWFVNLKVGFTPAGPTRRSLGLDSGPAPETDASPLRDSSSVRVTLLGFGMTITLVLEVHQLRATRAIVARHLLYGLELMVRKKARGGGQRAINDNCDMWLLAIGQQFLRDAVGV